MECVIFQGFLQKTPPLDKLIVVSSLAFWGLTIKFVHDGVAVLHVHAYTCTSISTCIFCMCTCAGISRGGCSVSGTTYVLRVALTLTPMKCAKCMELARDTREMCKGPSVQCVCTGTYTTWRRVELY